MDEPSRAALVTGGTEAVGRATATELARRGWSVYLQHSPGSAAEEARAAVQAEAPAESGAQALAGPADLARPEQRAQLVERVLESFDRIDLLVHAASPLPAPAVDLLELTEEALRRTMDAVLTAPLMLAQLVASEMVRLVEAGLAENPRLVFINSFGAYATSLDQAPQCLARAAGAMMTRLFADRLGEHGIGVYEVRMGLIAPAPGDPAHARYDRLIAQGLTPLRRWGRPSDVARAVAAVADGLLDFSTGEVINVDGGFHLRRL